MAARGENQNIARNVFEDLRQQILSGSLGPGERLPGERELAARYGTNRNTLREAVRRLEAGEDPERIEEDMGDALDGPGGMLGGPMGAPTRDDGLYEL